jgi:hypothetical protein
MTTTREAITNESELAIKIQQDFNDRLKQKCKPEQAKRADKSFEELREAIETKNKADLIIKSKLQELGDIVSEINNNDLKLRSEFRYGLCSKLWF